MIVKTPKLARLMNVYALVYAATLYDLYGTVLLSAYYTVPVHVNIRDDGRVHACQCLRAPTISAVARFGLTESQPRPPDPGEPKTRGALRGQFVLLFNCVLVSRAPSSFSSFLTLTHSHTTWAVPLHSAPSALPRPALRIPHTQLAALLMTFPTHLDRLCVSYAIVSLITTAYAMPAAVAASSSSSHLIPPEQPLDLSHRPVSIHESMASESIVELQDTERREVEEREDSLARDVSWSSMPCVDNAAHHPLPFARHYSQLSRRGNSAIGAAVGVVGGFLALIGALTAIFFYLRRPQRVRVRRTRRRRQTLDLIEELPAGDAENLPAPAHSPRIARFLPKVSMDGGRIALQKILSPADGATSPPAKDAIASPTATSRDGTNLERKGSFWKMWSSPRRSRSGSSTTTTQGPRSAAVTERASSRATPWGDRSDVPLAQPGAWSSSSSDGDEQQRPMRQAPWPTRQGSSQSLSQGRQAHAHTRRAMSPTPTDKHEVDVDLVSTEDADDADPFAYRAMSSMQSHATLSPDAPTSTTATSPRPAMPNTRSQTLPAWGAQVPGLPSRRATESGRRSPSPPSASSPIYPPSSSGRTQRRTMLPTYDAPASSSVPEPGSRHRENSPLSTLSVSEPLEESRRLSTTLPPAYSPPHADSPLTTALERLELDLELPMPSYDTPGSRPGTPTSMRGRPLPRLPPPGR